MAFYKPTLEQIKGAIEMRQQLDALIKSYDATRVITNIPLKTQDGSDAHGKTYDANTLLAWLLNNQADLRKIQSDSATLVDNRLKRFEDKLVKDTVRVPLNAVWSSDHFVVTLPGSFETLVPNVGSEAVAAYNLDNTPVLDEHGNQITFDLKKLQFNGIPSVVDPVASARTPDGSKVMKARTESFDFKIFPVGEFKLSELPEDYLVDNTELQAIAYQQAIDKLVIQLTKDSDLIDAIKKMIGTEAVKTQIEKEDKAIRDLVTASIAAQNEARENLKNNIDSRLLYQGDIYVPKTQAFNLTNSAATEFVLDETPNTGEISLNINGIIYDEEADAFTVNRAAKKITWTATAANGGFDLTNKITNKIVAHYYTTGRTEALAKTQAGV